MANNINVAVKRTKLIASVKQAIAVREKTESEYKAVQEYNDKLKADWLKKVASKLGEPTSINVQTSYNARVDVTYALPNNVAEPTYKRTPEGYDYSLREQLSSLKNALTLLEMSEEEIIKTSSYGSISKYL